MAQRRRRPGRPAYDSRQKLVAATCALLAERGYEATSPKMILDRARVGQGSMYHHYRGKEDLALDAIAHMRGRTTAFLKGQYDQTTASDATELDEAAVAATAENALTQLFDRSEGHALIRLLADPVVGAVEPLAVATQAWCDDVHALIVTRLRDDAPSGDSELADQAAALLAPELGATATSMLTAALGAGLLRLPRWTIPQEGARE